MKKIKHLLTPLMVVSLTSTVIPLLMTSCGQQNAWQLTNPDGSLVINVDLSNQGELTYSVAKNNKLVVDTSSLGMVFSAKVNGVEKTYDFTKDLTYVNVISNEKQFSYDCLSGKTSHVDVHYKERVITTKVDDIFMDVTFRALNDGYGFQYSFRSENENLSTLMWESENTQFNIPKNSLTYGMDYNPKRDKFSYEEHYSVRSLNDIGNDRQVSMPFGYDANGCYSFITESGLIGSGYHGSFLRKNDHNILTTIHAPACGKNPDLSVELPFTSPWRVSSVGSYATAFETTIVEDILGDVQPYLPDGVTDPNYYDSWVEPGLTSWSWLLHHEGSEKPYVQSDYEVQELYAQMSSSMGWKYTLFDAGWEGDHEVSEQKDFINHLKNAYGLKVLVWAHSMDDKFDEGKMDETLQGYANLGVNGLKIDFWDDGTGGVGPDHDFQMEDKQTLKRYEQLYKLAAKYHLVINCHGSNKPTGERRIYPHLLNREGIRGNEFNNIYSGQGLIHTITRGAIGPTDFTPVVKPVEMDVTTGYQMALPILLESGIPCMADDPETYLGIDGEELPPWHDFYRRLPAAWDESIFLSGNPQTNVVVARRKGNNWWVAGITSLQRTINVDFSFLGSGIYDATIYNGSDRGREASINKTIETITRDSKKTIEVTDNAGFVIEIRKSI